MTRPAHRAQSLANDMGDGRSFLRRAYHFFEFTSLSTRFSNIDSASIFFNSAFSFSSSFSRLAIGQFQGAVFLFPTVEGLLGYVVLPADRLGGFAAIGLPQNADHLFGLVRFAFHERSSIGLRNTHIKTGSTMEGHARDCWSV